MRIQETIRIYFKSFGIVLVPTVGYLVAFLLNSNMDNETVNTFAIIFLILAIVAIPIAIRNLLSFRNEKKRVINKVNKVFQTNMKGNISVMPYRNFDLIIKYLPFERLNIEFHILRNQISNLEHVPNFDYKESEIENSKTYLIEKTEDTYLRAVKNNIVTQLKEADNKNKLK